MATDSNPQPGTEAGPNFWRKLEILLTPMGGLFTALSVALVGFLGSRFLDQQQRRDADIRLYAELISKREEADSALRKDMFQSIISTFLSSKSGGVNQNLLNLELLAYNFHESLDLAPLFSDVQRHIDPATKEGQSYLSRLERMAREVSGRELAVLGEAGERYQVQVSFDDVGDGAQVAKPVEVDMTMPLSGPNDPDRTFKKRHFTLEVESSRKLTKELWVRLQISEFGSGPLSRLFKVGFFEFPMIDSIRLSHDQRCAVVLTDFGENNARMELVYFPGSRASLKEKPYYDEIVHELLSVREAADEHKQ